MEYENELNKLISNYQKQTVGEMEEDGGEQQSTFLEIEKFD